jgi:hypothetical protein
MFVGMLKAAIRDWDVFAALQHEFNYRDSSGFCKPFCCSAAKKIGGSVARV